MADPERDPVSCLFYSPYQLHVSETHASVSLFSGWDTSEFDNISHIPIKTSNDFYTLGDIIANDQNLHGEHVNIQAVVRSVSTHINKKRNHSYIKATKNKV